MRDVMIEVILTVVGIVFVTLFVANVVMPLKENQAVLAQTNSQLISSLQAEVNSGASMSVKGSSVRSQIDRNVGNTNVEIYVDGTKWNGKAYSACNIVINDSTEFSMETEIASGKTIYRYTTK